MRNPVASILIAPVRFYQRFISPAFPRRCRYYPTCSEYAVQSLTTHGVIKGLILGSWRILRCNPWSLGGVDHIPPKGSWKSPEWVPPADWAGHDIEEAPSRSLKFWRKDTGSMNSRAIETVPVSEVNEKES